VNADKDTLKSMAETILHFGKGMFFYETRWRKWRILEDKEKV
jgi:hypothetical protein